MASAKRGETAWTTGYDRPGGSPFDLAGLRRLTPRGLEDKPALADFRRAAQRCGKPGSCSRT